MDSPGWVAENRSVLTVSFSGAADPATVYAIGVDDPAVTENGVRFTIPKNAGAVKEEAAEHSYTMVFNNAQKPEDPATCPVISTNGDMNIEKYNLFTGRADVSVNVAQTDAKAAIDAGCAIIPNQPPSVAKL